MDLLTELAILVLAAFVGFEVISKVPNTLHTPLMSGTNAIHGIVVLGGLLLVGPAQGWLNDTLLVVAIAFGTINVVGGFLVTDRMLGMFKGKKPDPQVARARRSSSSSEPLRRHPAALHRGLRAVHQRAADVARAAHRGPRQSGRGGRDGDRGRGDAAHPGRRRLAVDRGRGGDRYCGRGAGRAQRADDRDAADGGAVQRRRRRRGGADQRWSSSARRPISRWRR